MTYSAIITIEFEVNLISALVDQETRIKIKFGFSVVIIIIIELFSFFCNIFMVLSIQNYKIRQPNKRKEKQKKHGLNSM